MRGRGLRREGRFEMRFATDWETEQCDIFMKSKTPKEPSIAVGMTESESDSEAEIEHLAHAALKEVEEWGWYNDLKGTARTFGICSAGGKIRAVSDNSEQQPQGTPS